MLPVNEPDRSLTLDLPDAPGSLRREDGEVTFLSATGPVLLEYAGAGGLRVAGRLHQAARVRAHTLHQGLLVTAMEDNTINIFSGRSQPSRDNMCR